MKLSQVQISDFEELEDFNLITLNFHTSDRSVGDLSWIGHLYYKNAYPF